MIAEGIETTEQRASYSSLAVNLARATSIPRPVDREAFQKLLESASNESRESGVSADSLWVPAS